MRKGKKLKAGNLSLDSKYWYSEILIPTNWLVTGMKVTRLKNRRVWQLQV